MKSKNRIILLLGVLSFAFIVLFGISGYYSAFKITSYLPGNIPVSPSTTDLNQIEIRNPWYIIGVTQKGRIIVMSLKRDVILSDLKYYSEYEGEKGNWGLKNVVVNSTNDSTITIKGNGPKMSIVYLSLIIHKFLPKLEVTINTQYYSKTIINREALVALFNVSVSEVYLKNRKIDKENFEKEYWLNKEGVRFGSKDMSALIYHTPSISSLQLDTEKNLLFINLDYSLDHPFAKMPFLKNGDGKLGKGGDMIDLSKAIYKKGSERNNSFTINFGSLPKVTPRLMSVPYGYQAGYIFTEHADGGTIQTQRAVYFGSENITKASEATGGFVKHKIPVTKSVFYIDPAGTNGSAIFEKQNDSLLINFLDQLNGTGLYDICLHTPENMNSNRKVLEKSIKFMKDRYNTISWIDHGFYGGLINRECMVADGLDSSSTYYAADLWDKYSTRYFWSPAVEFIRESKYTTIKSKIEALKFYDAYVGFWKNYISPRELKEMNACYATKELSRRYVNVFEFNSLMPHFGDSYPTPLYWQNPSISNKFYSWATDYVHGYNNLSPKVVKRAQVQVDNLVNDWGIFISHGYYPRKDFYKFTIKDQKGKFTINPFFDEILGYIAQKRDKGELYATNVNELLSYWIKLDSISFDYLPNGDINIVNNNGLPIKGLALALNTKNLKINGKVPTMRIVGDDTIIWFDIKGNETIKLTLTY